MKELGPIHDFYILKRLNRLDINAIIKVYTQNNREMEG